MAKEFKMSQARYDELKQELDYSKTTRADEVAELIKEARGFGDPSKVSFLNNSYVDIRLIIAIL